MSEWPTAKRQIGRVEFPFRGQGFVVRTERVEAFDVVAIPEEKLEGFRVMGDINHVVHHVLQSGGLVSISTG